MVIIDGFEGKVYIEPDQTDNDQNAGKAEDESA